MPKGTTPAQLFARIFAVWVDKNAPQAERDNAERKLDAWLKRHSKTRADISAILIQAAADDAAAQPPPPPSDPRDGAPHPFDSPEFTPAGLVEGILTKYLTMKPWVSVIYSLYICFTHVFTRFRIVPRVVFTSEYPDSGKTTGIDVGWNLMFRPNPEALGTGAAVRDFLDEGPGTVSLDELDQLDAEARRALLLIWNLGHKRGAKYSLMIGGEKKLINLCAPMIMAGVGKFLGATQMSRAFKLEWEPYTEETRPERKYDDEDVSDLNAVYSFLRNWAAKVKLNLGPPMPPGVLRRFEDNVRPLLAIADSCGPEWGRRAREAVIFLLEKEKAEHPKITLIRHGLVIFAALEVDEIKSTRFNQEVKRLDLPDANWTRYRGPSGMEYVHSLTMAEQATLLEMVGIKSTRVRPPGEKQCRGLKLAQFQEAQRKYGVVIPDDVEPGRARLRLITPFD